MGNAAERDNGYGGRHAAGVRRERPLPAGRRPHWNPLNQHRASGRLGHRRHVAGQIVDRVGPVGAGLHAINNYEAATGAGGTLVDATT